MPDPREAIYDVLKAKFLRAKDEQARREKLAAAKAAWDEYEQQNKVARANYRNLK